MPDVTRRQFLRNASIGAATAGVIAATGTGIFTALESTGGTPDALSAAGGQADAADLASLEGSDVFARVVDAKAGHIKIYVGTKAVDFTSRAVARELVKAAR